VVRFATNQEGQVFFLPGFLAAKARERREYAVLPNVRAYLDLGYKPEVIQISCQPDDAAPSEDLR
jgi:hypothetical protein